MGRFFKLCDDIDFCLRHGDKTHPSLAHQRGLLHAVFGHCHVHAAYGVLASNALAAMRSAVVCATLSRTYDGRAMAAGTAARLGVRRGDRLEGAALSGG